MRRDPERLSFEIVARDGRARAGILRTPHGEVSTPAFVPLATKGVVKSLAAHEVAELGFELVLGNTYHLMLSPGEERIGELGGLHEFMGWKRTIITDSGGFQVFSLAHGTVADEIKGRRGRSVGPSDVLEVGEGGVRFRSYIDGSEHELSPERSMEVQAELGSDIALTLDECTPFRAERDYTARSTERTHRWLERCMSWHEEHGPRGQAVFGIVQGGVYEDQRRESAEYISASGVDGLAIGGSLGRDKEEMMGVVAMTVPFLPEEAPKHLLGIGEADDLLRGIEAGIDIFDCSVPTRLARHGMALAPLPEHRFRYNLRRGAHALEEGPLVEGCPCSTCSHHTRAYVHYLSKAEELTGVRLLTLHNIAFTRSVVTGARAAIAAGSYSAYRDAVLGGAAPWDVR